MWREMQQRLEISPSTLTRAELVQWVNTSLPCSSPNKGTVTPIKKVEQCGNGVPYVLLLPTMLPVLYTPLLTKAKVPAHHEFEAVINLKLMQEALQRNGIPKPDILTDDLVKIINGNFQANLHLLQWFHGLYTALKESGIEACRRTVSPGDARPTDILARFKPDSQVSENGRRMQWLREGEQHQVQGNSYVNHEGRDAPRATPNTSREGSSSQSSQVNFTSPQIQTKVKSRKPVKRELSVASSDKGRARPCSAPTTIIKHTAPPSKAAPAIQRQKPTTPKGTLTRSTGIQRTATPRSRSQSVGISINKAHGHARSPILRFSGLASRHAPAINFATGADSNSTALSSGGGVRWEQTHTTWSSGLNISNMANNGIHSRGRTRRTPKLSVAKAEGVLPDAFQEEIPTEEESQDTALCSSKRAITQQKNSDSSNGVCKQTNSLLLTDNGEVSYHVKSQVTSEALTQQLQEVTMEKHFYYDKLRIIECLVVKELNSKTMGAAALANSIKDILYATK